MIRVTDATSAEIPAIANLIGELRALEGLAEPVGLESVRAYLDDPDAEVLVALETPAGPESAHAAEVLGVLSLRVMLDLFHGRPTALIQELVVAEGQRGRGIGGALLDAALARARERGCVEIAVVTGERNEAGQAAYRSRGFEQDGLYFERHFEG